MRDIATTTARAWALSRRDGMILGFTDHDTTLSFGGIRFRPQSGMTASAVVQGLGLSVDNTEAMGILSDGAITETDILAGRWDGAEVLMWDVDWSQPAQNRLTFRGTLGEITCADGTFRAELRGLAEGLNQPTGRVYHPRCSARLGDVQCGFDCTREGYWAEGIIETVDAASVTLSGVGSFDKGWFQGGVMVVSSGPAAGLSVPIRQDLQVGKLRQVALWKNPTIAPGLGDTVRLTAGCDKAAKTCRLKFLNFANFRGFPHIPPEEWMINPHAAGSK
ncbi:MAG: hypothetical protein DI498_09540 [Paracoccus denitrificans]|nr:MAG: hypothetical protein DI498_09540 [Paracoccus denitrificans]PZO83952.1 MAG: hypothetical protein DI633_09540 [Paracoccus denitrificans]